MNCSACGAALAAGSTWCPACGYAVSTSSNASTISYMNFGSFEEPVVAPPIPQTKEARPQSTDIAPITSYGQAVVPGYAAQPVDTPQQIPQVAQSQPQHTSRVLLVTLIVLAILIVIGGVYTPLRRAYSTFIEPGLNQPNLLTVIARGSSIYLYINKHFLGQASDSTYTTGNIGLLAENYTKPADVAFNNVQVWNLS